MSKYDLYRNTICKDNDNDYIILFKDEESAKIVFDEFNQKDQRIAELEKQNQTAVKEFADEILKNISEEIFDSYQFENGELEREILNRTKNYILELLKERGIE